jgi:hypothetical protein
MITVLFTCHKCGIQRVRVPVKERTPGQDIKEWMDSVMVECGKVHKRISGRCDSRHLDLAIPVPDKGPVGESAPEIKEPLSDDFMKSKGAN